MSTPPSIDVRRRKLLAAGDVRRWHTHGRLEQNVAQHSWRVAALICLSQPNASAELLRAAILHDVGELLFADIPSPMKSKYPILSEIDNLEYERMLRELYISEPELDENEQWMLRYYDRLEARLFLEEQMPTERTRSIIERLDQMMAEDDAERHKVAKQLLDEASQ